VKLSIDFHLVSLLRRKECRNLYCNPSTYSGRIRLHVSAKYVFLFYLKIMMFWFIAAFIHIY